MRVFIFVLIEFVLVINNISTCFAFGKAAGKTFRSQPVCLTEACIKRANYLLHLMDPTVNPCKDFYRFSCGNFLQYLEDDRYRDTNVWLAEYSTQSRLSQILQAEPLAEDPLAYQHVKLLYKMCMDEATLDKQGVAPLVELLETAGGWPVLGNWSSESWNHLEMELRLRDLGFEGGSLFQMISINTTRGKLVELNDEGYLTKGMSQLGEGSPQAQRQFEYMVEVAVLLGANRQSAEDQMLEVLHFQMDLVLLRGGRLKLKNEQNETVSNTYFNSYLLENFTEEYPWMDWKKLFNKTIWKSVEPAVRPGEPVMIGVINVNYFKNLGSFLQSYHSEVVANAMMWDAVSKVVDRLTSKLRSLKPKNKQRTEECIDEVASSFPLALNSIFATAFNDTKREVEAMTEKLRQELLMDILETPWLDDETRLLVEEKIIRLGKIIGYPEELGNATLLDEDHKRLSMNKEHFFKAALDIQKWNTEIRNRINPNLRSPEELPNWFRSAMFVRIVNAFNDITSNKIEIPAATLQNPYFDVGVPEYANYGALGASTVGHEILHSLDNDGALLDWKGDEGNGWTNASTEAFVAKKQCIVDEYNRFIESQSKLALNGTESQGENIADNGGLKIAYRAYKRLMGEREEPRLPGLEEFNNEQMFMISYASSWCTKYTKEEVQDMVEGDPHSPAEFRVNGVVMNSPEFSRLFHCKRGDPMNPDKKCVLFGN